MTPNRMLAIAALILAILSLFMGGFPFLAAAVICVALAMLL